MPAWINRCFVKNEKLYDVVYTVKIINLHKKEDQLMYRVWKSRKNAEDDLRDLDMKEGMPTLVSARLLKPWNECVTRMTDVCYFVSKNDIVVMG